MAVTSGNPFYFSFILNEFVVSFEKMMYFERQETGSGNFEMEGLGPQ